MSNPVGRPPDLEKRSLRLKYRLTERNARRMLTPQMMMQLRLCKSEAARRILLGVSK